MFGYIIVLSYYYAETYDDGYIFAIATIIVARLAREVPKPSHWLKALALRGALDGTTISQPGSTLALRAMAIVPF